MSWRYKFYSRKRLVGIIKERDAEILRLNKKVSNYHVIDLECDNDAKRKQISDLLNDRLRLVKRIEELTNELIDAKEKSNEYQLNLLEKELKDGKQGKDNT